MVGETEGMADEMESTYDGVQMISPDLVLLVHDLIFPVGVLVTLVYFCAALFVISQTLTLFSFLISLRLLVFHSTAMCKVESIQFTH